ncbi:MAG TPA: hypothetical protein VGO59_03690 [Verrucomicrobiae bacterium]
MKTTLTSFSNRLILLAALLMAALPARAGLTVNLLVYHTVPGLSTFNGYFIAPILSTNTTPPDAPLGNYLVSSPGGSSQSQYEMTSTNFTGGFSGISYPDYDSFIEALTNGNWTITVTNGTSTSRFSFSVSAPGLTSNGFSGPVTAVFPTNSEAGVTNHPILTWQGPSSWEGDLTVEDYNSDFSFFQSADLPTDQTSWAVPAALPAGGHIFGVIYTSNASPVIVASTPTNIIGGAPISGWVSTSTLETYQFIPFSVNGPANGGGSGGVITGNIVNQTDFQTYTISDGAHSAEFLWSESAPGTTAWIYSTANTSVALATGVTSVNQITNAAIYAPFSSAYIGPLSDAGANGGIGQFVVLQSTSGYYAVVRIDDVQDNDTLNATWWFQTNGTGDFSSFAGPPTLAQALNATNLAWTTGGDTSWFVETTNAHDNVAAAQSGSVANGQFSQLQATVTGPGTLTFWWSTQSALNELYFDLEFDLDGSYWDNIYNDQPWIQEPAINIPPGTHTLSWTAYGANFASDAGFADQVSFTPIIGTTVLQTAQFEPVIVNDQSVVTPGGGYWVEPYLFGIQPAPLTADEIVSPTGKFSYAYSNAITAGALHHDPVNSWAELANECTNGLWTLYVNKGDPSETQFKFSVSLDGLDTNLLAPVTVLAPSNGSVNVATNAPVQWSAPNSPHSSIFVSIGYPTNNAFGTYLGSGESLLDATNWLPSDPMNYGPGGYSYGTNYALLEVSYFSLPAIASTTPTNAAFDVISNWTTTGEIETRSSDSFVAGAPAPLPVQLITPPPVSNGGNFLLTFQTVAGRSETIQISTNLASGWVDATNFIGDGSTQQLSFPTTNAPGEYFRVITQ